MSDELQNQVAVDSQESAPEQVNPPVVEQEKVVEQDEPKVPLKRIHKVTKEKHELLRKVKELEEQLKEKQGPVGPVEPVKPAIEDKGIDFDQGKLDAAMGQYNLKKQAYDEHLFKRNVQSEVERQLLVKENETRAKEADLAFEASEFKYAETNPTYWDDIAGFPHFRNETLSVLKAAGVEAVHEASKLGLGPELADMTPIQAAMKIGEIKANLANVNKVSSASAPPDTLSGGSAVVEENNHGYVMGD